MEDLSIGEFLFSVWFMIGVLDTIYPHFAGA